MSYCMTCGAEIGSAGCTNSGCLSLKIYPVMSPVALPPGVGVFQPIPRVVKININWKARAEAAEEKLTYDRARAAALEKDRDYWKARAEAAEMDLAVLKAGAVSREFHMAELERNAKERITLEQRAEAAEKKCAHACTRSEERLALTLRLQAQLDAAEKEVDKRKCVECQNDPGHEYHTCMDNAFKVIIDLREEVARLREAAGAFLHVVDGYEHTIARQELITLLDPPAQESQAKTVEELLQYVKDHLPTGWGWAVNTDGSFSVFWGDGVMKTTIHCMEGFEEKTFPPEPIDFATSPMLPCPICGGGGHPPTPAQEGKEEPDWICSQCGKKVPWKALTWRGVIHFGYGKPCQAICPECVKAQEGKANGG